VTENLVSEVTTLWRYTNAFIIIFISVIIIIIIITSSFDFDPDSVRVNHHA